MHAQLTGTRRDQGTPGPNMTRPGAHVAAVPRAQVSTKTREYGPAVVKKIQEEALYYSDARDGVGRDMDSGLCCLCAKARPDGGSKAGALA